MNKTIFKKYGVVTKKGVETTYATSRSIAAGALNTQTKRVVYLYKQIQQSEMEELMKAGKL